MRNKKSICRKLEKVWNCENCVENGKGEKRGKYNKQAKGRRRKIELLSLYIISFTSYSEKHFVKKTFRPDD